MRKLPGTFGEPYASKDARTVRRGLAGNVLWRNVVELTKEDYALAFYSIEVVGGSNPLTPTYEKARSSFVDWLPA